MIQTKIFIIHNMAYDVIKEYEFKLFCLNRTAFQLFLFIFFCVSFLFHSINFIVIKFAVWFCIHILLFGFLSFCLFLFFCKMMTTHRIKIQANLSNQTMSFSLSFSLYTFWFFIFLILLSSFEPQKHIFSIHIH